MGKCIIKEYPIDELKIVIKESKNVKEILNKIGYSIGKTTNVCKSTKNIFYEICRENNIDVSHLKTQGDKTKLLKCKNCGDQISNTNKSGLCKSCKQEKKINDWKTTGSLNINVNTMIRGTIRDYIYEKQNFCCAICGMSNIWNNKHINFVLDHIDGNASNNSEENLRLICPNCDSQLDTYKSKNKNSERSYRRKAG